MPADRRGLAGWLAGLVMVELVAFEVVRRVFAGTARGQQLDTAALTGNSIGEERIRPLVFTTLDTVSLLSVLVAVAAVGFIALMRGRVLLAAVTTGMVVGANVTTQVLKVYLTRPEFGVDLARAAAGNSLPSGHTTVTASVVVALVLVLPAAVRAPAAMIGAGVTGLVGVATLSAGWHRPSDAVAALLVVGAWAALAALVLVLTGRRTGADRGGVSGGSGGSGDRGAGGGDGAGEGGHGRTVLTLVLAGLPLAVLAAVALLVTNTALAAPGAPPPEGLSRARLSVAYAGGAAGIFATACAVMALVVVTVHRVVPTRG